MPAKAEVLQLGAVLMDPGEGSAMDIVFNQKSNPTSMRIPDEAYQINGIYVQDLRYLPVDQMSMNTFSYLMERLGDVTLVTYNGESYDLPILKRYAVPVGDLPHIDLYRVGQRFEELFSHGLKVSEVYLGYLEKPSVGAHDAIPEVMATLGILGKFVTDRRLSYSELG